MESRCWILITWHCGYHCYITDRINTIANIDIDNPINLYDEKGDIVSLSLEDGVNIRFEVACPFNVRRNVNYSRNEVFIIKNRNGCYSLFIPKEKVSLRHIKSETKEESNGMHLHTYNIYEVRGEIIGFYGRKSSTYVSPYYHEVESKDMFTFHGKLTIEETEKFKKARKLYDELIKLNIIYGYIDIYDCGRLLDYFTIKRKRNGKA